MQISKKMADGIECLNAKKALQEGDVKKSLFFLRDLLKQGRIAAAHKLAKGLTAVSQEATEKVIDIYKDSIRENVDTAFEIVREIDDIGMPIHLNREIIDYFADCAANKAFG